MLKKIACVLLLCAAHSLFGQDKLTIAWDVSLSMQDRNLEKEFGFLDTYFKKYPNTQTRVILFNGIQSTQNNFTVTNGNWEAVKEALSQAIYDGATGYQTLTKVWQDGTTLLFTDGIENIEEDVPSLGKQLYVINSQRENNLKNLQFLALSNKGRFIDLTPIAGDEKDQNVFDGYIHGLDVPMEIITIRVKDTNTKVKPNEDGSFEIAANPGDVVVFEAPGVTPIEKTVYNNEDLNVWMEYDGVELDEVLLEKKKKQEEETEEVDIGNGSQKKRNLGYGVTTIESEDFNTAATTISDAVRGRLPGVRGSQLETSIIRGQTSLVGNNFPLIVLDDAPLPIGQSTDFISPGTIASVTVLKGFAATTLYGSEASGGVILIKTKAKAEMERIEQRDQEAKRVVKRYEGAATSAPKYNKGYLTALEREPDVVSAYTLYLKQRSAFKDDPSYFIDLFDFFSNKNTRIAKSIGYTILEEHSNDFGALRTLLFKARQKQLNDMELHIAKAIVETYPNKIQSYMDLAMAQKNNGNLQAALDILIGITNGTLRPSLDFNPLRKTADQEIRNLLAHHKSKLETSKTQVYHLKKEPLEARIVFDWSQWDSDFELIFISPTENYTRWKHTLDEPERLKEELKQGYSQEEFEIAGGEKGTWKVIVKYLGTRSKKKSPEYIRCFVQYNFGKENERSEEYLIHLFEEGSEQLAFSLQTQ